MQIYNGHKVGTVPVVSIFTLRPSICRTVQHPVGVVLDQFASLIADSGQPFGGNVLGHHVTLTIPSDRRHFWSPWYNIDVEANPKHADQSVVRLRFSPHPNIWTSIALGYLALFTTGSLAALFGISQMLAETAPTAFLAVPACALLGVAILVASRIGQSLAASQMTELEQAIEPLLSDSSHQPKTAVSVAAEL